MKRDLADKEDLYRILSEFYLSLRKDEVLSHFFVKFNDDQVLMQHLRDLSDFWEQSLFYTGTYTKNVMQIHQEVDQKNKMEDFKLSLTECQGHNLLNFRIYFKDKQGESKPTKKGVTVNVKLFPELKKAILEAEKLLKEKEML